MKKIFSLLTLFAVCINFAIAETFPVTPVLYKLGIVGQQDNTSFNSTEISGAGITNAYSITLLFDKDASSGIKTGVERSGVFQLITSFTTSGDGYKGGIEINGSSSGTPRIVSAGGFYSYTGFVAGYNINSYENGTPRTESGQMADLRNALTYFDWDNIEYMAITMTYSHSVGTNLYFTIKKTDGTFTELKASDTGLHWSNQTITSINFNTKFIDDVYVFSSVLSEDNAKTANKAAMTRLTEEEVTAAKANIKIGVGYPKTTTTTYQALNSVSTSTRKFVIDGIIDAYKAESDVELPEDGKAYYIINGQYNSSGEMEANQYVLYNSNDKMSVKAYSVETLDESCIWVVRKIEDGYYALVSATGNGGYIHWTDNTDENRLLVTTYSEGDNNNKTKMHIAKIVHTSNVIPTNAQLFGYLSLRGYRTVNNGSDSPLIFKGASAGFDSTIEDIVRYKNGNVTSQFSSAVQFVKVPNYTANQVSLKAPTKKPDGKTYSSIYLPYPVKVPEGVKAYYCTLNENSLHLEDIGDKIPARTGAILVGESAGTQTLVPATSETSENVDANVLAGVLENTLTSDLGSRIYVLNGGQSAGIGFYPYSQSATLTAYKAYYNASAQGARDFYLFGSDDSATGIEGLSEDVDNQNETFDNTRKVLLDGKVVVVRNGKKYSITGQIYK